MPSSPLYRTPVFILRVSFFLSSPRLHFLLSLLPLFCFEWAVLEEATVLVQAPKKRARGARRSGEERRRRDERDKVFGMIVSAHPHRGNANAQVFEFG